jgi:hypothetical protein
MSQILSLNSIGGSMKKRSLLGLLGMPIVIICLLLAVITGGSGLPVPCVDLAVMLDGREAVVVDSLISLSKGTKLDKGVLGMLTPQGEKDGRDVYGLNALCGPAETLVERAAQQQGWVSEEELAQLKVGLAAAFLGLVVIIFALIILRKRFAPLPSYSM